MKVERQSAASTSEQYRQLFEALSLPILIWKGNGQVLVANPAASACLNSSGSDLNALRLADLGWPVADPDFLRWQRLGHAGDYVSAAELRLYPGGPPLALELRTVSLHWNGQPAYASVLMPRPESTMAASNADVIKWRAITNSTRDAIVMMDQEGRISFWNPAAGKMFGYDSSEILGRNLHFLLAPKRYHKPHQEAFRIFQKTGEGQAIDRTLELYARHRDGHEIAIELSLSKLLLHDAWHTIGIIRDITARKQADVELRESEERFRTLHDASFGGIAIHDQGLILDCNQGLATMTGFTVEELIGMDGLMLIAPDWRSYVMERIQTGFQEPYEAEGLRKDGSTYPMSLRGSNIPYQGRVVRVTEFRDITEQKRAEEERKLLEAQLTQAQKMEAIGTLAGGIAHDFNNILSAILGYVELAQRVVSASSPAIRYLDKALQGVQRAISLVSQILSFSRQSSSGRVPLQMELILAESLKLLRPLLPTTITIERKVADQCWPILADPTQMHQIMMNLCTNAFHAMEEDGGTLTVTLGNAELNQLSQPGLAPGRYLHLSIDDTGPGIAGTILDRIFDPYFTTKAVGKGSGMGLAIVHGIVKSHGGSITVQSEPGQGSTFHIYLPTVDEGEPQQERDEQPLPTGRERILLIDDEEMVADASRVLLEHLGYQLTVFTSSPQALQAFEQSPAQWDLVLTDQTMPGMTGFVLAQRMLATRPDLPIIICTGHSSIISRKQALAAGIRGFAMKPFSLHEIAKLLRSVLDQSPAAPE